MKKACFAILCILVLAPACFSAGPELRIRPYYLSPGDDDLWDSASGLDAQATFWLDQNLGIALTAGVSRWEANDDYRYDDDGYLCWLDGSALMTSFGPSVLFRPGIPNSLVELTFEAGLRYIAVDSDVDFYLDDGATTYVGELDMDDGVVGVLGVDAGIPISRQAKLTVGLGYQFDLNKGDADWYGVEIGENEMKGFYLNFGINLSM